MKTQHAFAILKQSIFLMLQSSLTQPTGEEIEVNTNEGGTVLVPILYGGFVVVGVIGDWVAVLGAGIETAFSAMLATVQQANATNGSPVGLLLAIVDDDDARMPDYSALDATFALEAKAAIDWWLTVNSFANSPEGAIKDVIEYTFGKFREGFSIGEDFV